VWLHQIIEVVDVGRDFDRDFILNLKLGDEACDARFGQRISRCVYRLIIGEKADDEVSLMGSGANSRDKASESNLTFLH
jgi:hypothetical protein